MKFPFFAALHALVASQRPRADFKGVTVQAKPAGYKFTPVPRVPYHRCAKAVSRRAVQLLKHQHPYRHAHADR